MAKETKTAATKEYMRTGKQVSETETDPPRRRERTGKVGRCQSCDGLTGRIAPDIIVGRAGKGDGCSAGVVALMGMSTAKQRAQCVEGVRGGL